jgi:CO/xanthine dehydrogenase FAD-binding subunit
MNLWQNYFQPATIPDAILSLQQAGKPLAIVAGGTDLIIDLKQGRHPPVNTLVDISGIPELLMVEQRKNHLFIGAGVTVSSLGRNPLVNTHARCLVDACYLIAGPQVRNVATIGGNVAHALPAADGTIALLSLDTQAVIENANGASQIPLVDFFFSPGESILNEDELLTGFLLPLCEKGQASAFRRIMRPQGVALPILNCAVWVERCGDIITSARIAIGPGGATPFRARSAEAFLAGKPLSLELIDEAGRVILQEANFRTSARRASREYRRHISLSLFHDTYTSAWERAAQAV